MTTEEIQNIYALDVKSKEIYILDAVSGRKGYFCLGCGKEMQAVKSIIQGRKSYFRHDVEANKAKGKCTYSDETYRHKLAKEALQISKRIKVPAILKYNPSNQGDALLIRPSHYVEAHSVSIELSFYETDDGEVKWGKDIGEGKNLLIRPDVTFFDNSGQPILLIEIVATHKLTEDKIILMRRLGIDTVTVTIPKDSPEAIRQTFEEVNRTKWIYNYEQETTQYLSLSDSDAEAIPSIDEQQRRDFRITFKCRQAEIGDLIRRIGRCLESEQFRTVIEANRRELQRVEGNADELRTIIREQSERDSQFLIGEQQGEVENFRKARGKNQSIIDRIEQQYKDSERRYIDKAREIATKQAEIERASRERIATSEREEKLFETAKSELEQQEISIGEATRKAERFIIEAKGNNGSRGRDFEQREARNRANREGEYRRGKEIKEQAERDIARELENRGEAFKRYEDRRSELGTKYDEFCKSTIEAVKRGDFNGVPQLDEGYKAMLSRRGLLSDYSENERTHKRYRSIREFLISGAFKVWLPKS